MPKPKMLWTGKWTWRVYDADGSLLKEEVFPNGATVVGMNDVLNCYFAGGPQRLVWYLGLIDTNGFLALSASDSMGSHPGWQEFTSYSGNRQQWNPNPPAGGLTINSNPVGFLMSAGATIAGAFIVSDSTKMGGAGILYATGLGAQPVQLGAGQNLSVQYSPIMQLGN